MTPAQAYAAVREVIPDDKSLRPTLEALKKPLGSLVQCHGYGACMDAGMYDNERAQNLYKNSTNQSQVLAAP